jgi:predicted NUDIX family phosphoesterase
MRLPSAWISSTIALSADFFSYLSAADIRWIERSEAETNSAYKQIIPYVVVRQSTGQILYYPRHGAESRLHGLYSCGIGGHIDAKDAGETFLDTVTSGMMRELSEELADFQASRIRLVYKGVINETETAVGQVHLGLVYAGICQSGYIPHPAEELTGMDWKTPEALRFIKKELWSDLALRLILQDI